TIEIELWVDGKMRPFAIDPNEEFDGDRELFAAFGPQKYGFRWKVVFDGVVQYDNGHDGDAVRLLKNPKLPCFQKFRDLTFDIFKLERGKAPEPTIEGDYFVFKEEREKNE